MLTFFVYPRSNAENQTVREAVRTKSQKECEVKQMAMSRAELKKLGLEDSVIEKIIEMHAETVDGLKSERDEQKNTAAESIAQMQKQLSEMQSTLTQSNTQYETLKKDFDAYRDGVEKQETHRAKETAYRALLQSVGIKGDKRIDAILRTTPLDDLELSEDGTLKNREALENAAKEDWSEFITTTETRGAKTDTPPANGGTRMTRAQIAGIKDPTQRRAAIADNLEVFTEERT